MGGGQDKGRRVAGKGRDTYMEPGGHYRKNKRKKKKMEAARDKNEGKKSSVPPFTNGGKMI